MSTGREEDDTRVRGCCSLHNAAKTKIILDFIFAVITLVSRFMFTASIVDTNVFQIIVSSIAVSVSLLGLLCIFKKLRTTLMIFLLLDALALILNVLAWIVIVTKVSKSSLYEALCNSPGDCPVLFNENYVIGIILSVMGAIFFVLNLIFLKCYIELLQYWEREAREREQQAEARKRSALNVTTDVQTSLLGTPHTPKTSRWSILSRPSSLGQSAA